MTAYEQLINMKPEDIQLLITSGVMKETVARDMKAYKYFMNDLKITGSRMQSRMNTSIQFYCCEDSVSKIIKRMTNDKI